MNSQQAKEIPIIDYLNSLGHNPEKIMGKNYWFLSPLRNEKTPSFKVYIHSNLFYDLQKVISVSNCHQDCIFCHQASFSDDG
jgi:hypothetical protein